MTELILVKYGELTTKKDNRSFFIKTLEKNIKTLLPGINLKFQSTYSQMYIEVEEGDISEVLKQLQCVFGIHKIIRTRKLENNLDTIKEEIIKLLKLINFKTFKVETKRSLKTFEPNSLEINNIIGGFILKNINDIKVDVHNPDILVNVEIRKEGTFIHTNSSEIPGLGGYPVGIQGKGLLMLSGGIDSPVAGYLALKRGVNIEAVYFDSPPHTSLQAKNKVIELTNILNNYSGHLKLHVVPFTKLQQTIYKEVPDNYMITIMRRMMYRIMTELSKKRRSLVIINGESIGQVASQTLTSINVINEVTNLPIIRPVACLDKLEIIEIAKKIGTYETSILPFEDCCTIFVPKHPVINPELAKCLLYETTFDYSSLIEECVKNIETISLTESKKEDLL